MPETNLACVPKIPRCPNMYPQSFVQGLYDQKGTFYEKVIGNHCNILHATVHTKNYK